MYTSPCVIQKGMESKICRVCLDRTATISLFDTVDDVQYRHKVKKCVGVSIEEGDGLPDAICDSCALELGASYEFALKCEASDRALRCLDLLHSCGLKEEHIKAEVKLEEPIYLTPNDNIQELTNQNIGYINNHDNYEYFDSLSDNIDNLDVASENLKNDRPKKKRILQEKYKKPLPNHLRKIKHRVYSGPVQCMTCGRILKCHSAYEQHMRTHTKEKPFICDVCHKSFRSKSSMKRHIYKHYGIDEVELRKLRPLPDWDRRKKGNNASTTPVLCILCVVCGLKLNSASALETHMRKHTGDKPFSCRECSKCYSLKGSLRRHEETFHTKFKQLKYVCEHCGKNFSHKSNIIIHLRTHTGEKPYSCPYCEEKFAQISSLIRHKRSHTGERPFKCETCGKGFSDRSLVRRHMAAHSDARNFVCHICSKGLKTRQALKVHVDLHNSAGKHVCADCGVTFTVKGNLTSHVRRQHSARSGACALCDKTVPDLAAHVRWHSGEKPHVCKICNQGFMSKRGMSHHIGFKHRDSAKFKCTTGQCDRAFPTISMLEFHVLKAHLDRTPYICSHCARGFLRPCDLSRHLRVNHMDNTQIKSQFIKTVQISDPA